MIKIDEFQARRFRLMRNMGSGAALIPTSHETYRNRDSQYPFRFDSHFYYLTGFQEPESVLLLITGDQPKSVLFCRDKDMEREIWDGFRYGPAAAKEEFGFDETYSITQLDEIAPKLLENQPKLFYCLGTDSIWNTRVTSWLNQLRAQARTGVTAPNTILDIHFLLDEMRLYKSAGELDVMRRAATISAAAHNRALRFARPGRMEYEVEAEFLHEFYRHGSRSPAYSSIVAGGANACTLHYNANNHQLGDGDLLLIDAGCELEGYASDITRTFPVNGKFSSAQKDLYALVLAAQAAAIEKIRPGNRWNEPHDAAVNVLIQGFIDLGLCQGTPASVLESEDYKRFYMHRTGHWLGLDVHDAGQYKFDNSHVQSGEWRVLEPGMVLTVEPGCYIRPADNVPKHFWNIGIRIEDDAVVTSNGCEIITSAAIKKIDEIEATMAGH